MKVVDSKTMSLIDSRAQTEYEIPARVLMENAGIKAYAVCRDEIHEFSRPGALILFVAGSGNNGGDALVMARQAFLDGLNVAVLLSGPVKSDNAAANLDIIRKLKVRTFSIPDQPEESRHLLRTAAVVVDGIYGTGISGPLRPPGAALVVEINELAGKVVSIDLPSGLGDEFKSSYPAVRADLTLCLGLPKRCLYLPSARMLCGRIVHVPIGFPPPLVTDPQIPGELLRFSDIEPMRRAIPDDAHKGDRGKLAVFGGDIGTTGAPVLASESAARSRCGLVYLFVDEAAYIPVASHLTSVMARKWRPHDDPAQFDLNQYDAYLAGPGWGFDGRRPWLEMLITAGLKGVVDADGLTLLASFDEPPDFGGNAVLTPHPGEMGRLLGIDISEVLHDPVEAAAQAASTYNATVVLKSNVTTICEPGGRYRLFDGSNPALATGGTGDVLAGIIAGLVAGGYEAGDAASLGVLIHAKAAEVAFCELGWFLAEDLPPFVSKVFAGS